MIASPFPLRRLAFSLTLALMAVTALIAGLGHASAQSDAPQVMGVGPRANSVSVAPSTVVSVTFDHSMNPTTITSRTFRVHGSMSGRLSGTLGYDAAAWTATFDPARDLKPGELVAAILTTGTQDVTGTALAAPHRWTFVAQARRSSGRFTLDSMPHYTVGLRPHAMYGADLDGDGDVDLVTANTNDDTVSVLLNDGRGAFGPANPRDYAVGNGPYVVQGADLDGDGDVDLATSNYYGDGISILLNAGEGEFVPAVPRDYATGNGTRSVCLADLDGDGDVDAATANLSDDSASVLSNNGDGTFVPFTPRDYAVGHSPAGISCADLDGDGDVDLVTANWSDDSVSALLNDGAGAFTPASPRDYFVGKSPRSVQSADLDGDGDVDLAVANYSDRDVSILLNDGAAHFSPSASGDLPVNGSPTSIKIADLDGDRDLDLISGSITGDDVSVLLNDGSGNFAARRDYAAGDSPYSVYAADLNGDADLDLAVASYYEHQVSILLNMDLVIEKAVLTPTRRPGLPVTYTLSYTNHSVETIRGAVISDHVPISLTNVHYAYSGPLITPTAGLTYVTPTAGLTYVWQVAPLPPGARGVITIGAILNPALAENSAFDNHAVIAHPGERMTGTATMFVDGAPELWIHTSVAPRSLVAPGDDITCTIQVTAVGVFASPGWLTNTLPEGTHFVAATSGFTPLSPTAGASITWTLPPGIHRPSSAFHYTLVLTADGPTRIATNRAQAVYPGGLTAVDKVGIWVWSEAPAGACRRDVGLIFDRSGSMQEATRCYGCLDHGATYPLPFGNHCDSPDPVRYQDYTYISIEAEHYSSFLTEADYHQDWTEYPKIWWAMQRQPNRNTSGPDPRGAWMMVGPHSQGAMHYPTIDDILYPPDMYTTPRLDYDFTVPTAGNYYVWMRAQGGTGWSGSEHKWVHVGRDGTPMATGATPYSGPYNDGASSSKWRWTRVLQLDSLSTGQTYTLNFWAAAPGFRLDKIVLTNDTRTNLSDNGHPLDWDFPGVSDAGPVQTRGRTGWACMGPSHPTPDPRFVPLNPITGKLDDLYDGYQPIQDAKEAAKGFVRQLDPMLDQIAYVPYSSQAIIYQELYCQEHYGICDDFEPVVDSIESTYAAGSTNISQALWYGLLTLIAGLEPSGESLPPGPVPDAMHYGRPQVYGALVLISDGVANKYPSLPSGYGNCYSDDLWPDEPDESTSARHAKECVVWFAMRAREQGVAVHTVALGARADHELLAHVANLTGGDFYLAPDVSDLEEVMEAIEIKTQANCLSSGVEVAKQVTPEGSVVVGEQLAYTLQTTLSGWIRPSLWLSDHVPGHTALITATPGFTLAPDGSLAWPLPSGVFSEALVLTHTLALSVTGIPSGGALTNQASIGGITASVTLDVLAPPTYRLSKRVEPSSVIVGQRITYTLVVTTNRPDLPVTLTDTLPVGTAFISASGNPGPTAPAPGDTLTWSLAPPDWTDGQVTHTLALSVTGGSAAGALTNYAGVAGVTASAKLNIEAPTLEPYPDLVIGRTSHQPGQPVADQPIQFFVSVHNQGDSDAPTRLAVELYAKQSGFAPTGPADHAGGWCADPPACEQTRPDYLAFLDSLAAGETVSLSYSIVLSQAGAYQVYAQVDVDRVSGATEEYGALLESDEGNNVLHYGAVIVLEIPPYEVYLPIITKSRP